MTYKMKCWAVVIDSNPYLAPELQKIRLTGYCPDHPATRVPEQRITTTSIIDAVGTTVITKSGSIYELEDPDPQYLKWLADNKVVFDPENPIKFFKEP